MPTYNETMSGGSQSNSTALCNTAFEPQNFVPVIVPLRLRALAKANAGQRADRLDRQANGLAHWWNFSHAGGRQVYDTVGGVHGFIEGLGPEENWVSDADRGGFVFENAANDFVTIQDVNEVDNATQLTVSAWVKMSSLFTKMVIVSKNDDFQNGFLFGWDDVQGFTIRIPSLAGEHGYTGTSGYVTNRWYHLTFTYNGGLAGSNNKVRLYVDGVRKSLTFSGSFPTAILPNAVNFRVGAASVSGVLTYFWRGRLDDVRLYNRALTESEVFAVSRPESGTDLSLPTTVLLSAYQSVTKGTLGGGSAVMVEEYQNVGIGGAYGNGTASVHCVYSILPTGQGALVGGSAAAVHSYQPSGGVFGAGSADIFLDFVTLGGVVSGGTATVFGVQNEPPFGVVIQGALVGGIANVSRSIIKFYTAEGEAVVEGSASAAITNVRFQAEGGVSIEDSAVVNFAFVKNTTFYWNVHAKIEKSFTFYWNVGRLKIYWYRVVSKGLDPNGCPVIGSQCCQRYVMNVQARTVAELCQKLQKRKYKFPIQSVEKFSLPAETTELAALEADGVDTTCQTLIPVEVCSVPQCADYCVDHEAKQSIGFFAKAQVNAFSFYTASGEAFTGGTALASYVRNLPDFPHEMSGGPVLASETVFETDSYNGRGGVIVGGSAATQSSSWFYTGGVWPNIRPKRYGNTNIGQEVQSGDVPWSLMERVNKEDSLFSQSDISFGKKTRSLLTFGFGTDLPSDARVMGVQVRVGRISTQIGVRDAEVYLVKGGERISDNLAVKNIDWPLIETERVYGSNGLDGKINWRDPDGDHYEGALTVADLNDPSFGVEIRVAANLSLSTTIAKINYINLQVYYEFEHGSIVRIGGEARCRSANYHFAGAGKTVLNSTSVSKLGFRYISTGLGANGFGELNPGGHASISFYQTMSGGAFGSGDAKITPYFETMSGGAFGSGDAKITPYFETMSGGAFGSGESLRKYFLHYTAVGGPVLESQTFVPFVEYEYVSQGGPVLSGDVGVRSSDWNWSSLGGIVMSGDAEQRPGNVIPPLTDIGFDTRILEISVNFADDVDLQNATVLTSSVNKCDCSEVPLLMDFTQNFARDNNLAKFLVRNNYSTPNTVRMRYNQTNDSWQCNLHYRGQSAERGTPESWDITCELQCTSVIGGITIGRSIWKLSTQIIRKNLITGESFDTHVLVGIIPDGICSVNGSGLNFNITYNTTLNSATIRPNATIYQSTIFDNIGIFKNPGWINSPNLVLKISESGRAKPTQRVNLTDAVFV
jgi:hypothetical protein